MTSGEGTEGVPKVVGRGGIARARESWLNDGNPEHFGDAMLLCALAASGDCADGNCRLEGFCFRGLRSTEVRFCIERRLDEIERTLKEFGHLVFDQRRSLALAKIRGDVLNIRDNVLPLRKESASHSAKPDNPSVKITGARSEGET